MDISEAKRIATIQRLLSQRNTRVELCRNSFFHYFLYYFSPSIRYCKLAPYHRDRCKDAQEWFNIFVKWHRESAKTTILWVALECWKICYHKCDFIANLCADKRKAKAFNVAVINMLNSKLIKNDFGRLYERRKTQIDDYSIETTRGEFVTTNYIKVKAFGMGENIRWELFVKKNWEIVRPQHLFADDIDNSDNTKNKLIIDSDMEFIEWEVFGGLDADAQVVWLGNVIREDGRNPRIEKEHKNDPDWKIYSNFIYGKAWVIHWNPIRSRYVNTDKEMDAINTWTTNKKYHVISLEKKKRLEWSRWFAQNRLGIPLKAGESVIEEWWLKFYNPLTLPSSFDSTFICFDPATKTKEKNDFTGIVYGWRKWDNYYIIFSKSVKLSPWKVEIFIERLYDRYKSNKIIKEDNIEVGMTERMQLKWLPVKGVIAHKDKLTRLYEVSWLIEQWYVYFPQNGCENLIDQLTHYPDTEHDDEMDAFVYFLLAARGTKSSAVTFIK